MIQGWNNGHAARLREFLATETGGILIQGMRAEADEIPDGKTFEEEALISRESKGARRLINVVLLCATFDEKEAIERDDVDLEPSFTPLTD